ncbi:hypothetical protein ABW19_dt0207805 [Dactylella cylindrospora]|nr:hypothetical protein ABW19_dt0207805 [Dactylella cylindrospora]
MSPNIDEFKSAISQYLSDEAGLQTLVASALRDAETESDLSKALDTILTEPLSWKQASLRIQYVKDTLRVCDGDTGIFDFVLSDKTLSSLSDVAFKIYPTYAKKGHDEEAWNRFREALAQQEPLAALAGIMLLPDVYVPEEITRDSLALFFQKAMASGFNVKQTSISRFFDALKSRGEIDQIPVREHKPLREFLGTLQRLSAVVSELRDIDPLFQAAYHSARDITDKSLDDFISSLEGIGDLSERVIAIYNRAYIITVRNEQIWADLLRDRRKIPLVPVDGTFKRPIPPAKEEEYSNLPAGVDQEHEINLARLFGDMDASQSDETSSVFSPAAYLLDLLRLLRTSKVSEHKNVLDRFQERRPDILSLQLTKANTSKLVPYIDLANEAMEAYICRKVSVPGSGAMADAGANIYDDDDAEPATSLHISWPVYKEAIGGLVSPMATFPYNHATITVRETLLALNSSRYELFKHFRRYPTPEYENRMLVDEAYRRCLAAEALGLQFEDYVAITKEGYQSFHYLRKLLPNRVYNTQTYEKEIGLKNKVEYWGYTWPLFGEGLEEVQARSSTPFMMGVLDRTEAFDPTELTEDEICKIMINHPQYGLARVSDELLPRLGISFNTLLEILKTQYIGKLLIIDTQDKHTLYSETFRDLRIRQASALKNHFEGLSLDIMDNLQRFVRLWRKLQWDIPVLGMSICVAGDWGQTRDRNQISINPDVIDGLAAIKALHDLTEIDIEKLLPLWSDLPFHGADSMYNRLFLQSKLSRATPSLHIGDSGSYTFDDNLEYLLAAFSMTETDFDNLSPVTNITRESAWSIENICHVYRANTLCKMVRMGTENYSGWDRLYKSANILRDPQSTLDGMNKWYSFISMELPLSDLLGTLGQTTVFSPATITQADSLCTALKTGLLGLSTPLDKDVNNTQIYEASLLLTNDPQTAKSLCDLVEGVLYNTQNVVAVQASISINKPLPANLIFDSSISQIQLRGILSPGQMAEAVELSANAGWAAALKEVQEKAETSLRKLKKYLSEDAYEELLEILAQNPPKSSSKEDQEIYAAERRADYLKRFEEPIKNRKREQFLQQVLVSEFNGLEWAVLSSMLAMEIGESGKITALDILSSLLSTSSTTKGSSAKGFDVYFLPPQSGVHRVKISAATKAPSQGTKVVIDDLRVNGTLVPGSQTSTGWVSSELALVQGKAYHFESSTATLVQIVCQFPAQPDIALGSSNTVSAPIYEQILAMCERMGRALKVIELLKLSSEEIAFFQSRGFNYPDLSVEQIYEMAQYKTLSTTLHSKKAKMTPLEFFRWSGDERDIDVKDLSQNLSSLMALPEKQLSEYLDLRHPDMRRTTTNKPYLTAEEISSIYASFKLAQKLGAPIAQLFAWTDLLNPRDMRKEYDLASSIRTTLALTAGSGVYKADEKLRLYQQDVLTQYLIQKDAKMKSLGIRTIDKLFEWFLIDVKMGTEMQSSRIRQAIAAISFFVQRILLGLEKKNRIPTTCIDASKWKWMSKYSVWAATRKVFLYPENWVDPFLRSNKTPEFKKLESKLLQGQLDIKSINTILRGYIYDVNILANLEIQTYLWESTNKFQGIYHFFARTRTAPYHLYYRQLTATGVAETALRYQWMPWSRMEVEVAAQQVDNAGMDLDLPGTYMIPAIYHGCLFVFLPEFSLKKKTGPAFPASVGKFGQLADTPISNLSVSNYYEIKIGWTELRNGNWTPKQISTSTLSLEFGHDVPPISSFRFWVRGRQTGKNPDDETVLAIDVERWYSKKVNDVDQDMREFRGRFEMRGYQLLLVENPDLDKNLVKVTIPTKFAKLQHHTTATDLEGLRKELEKYHAGSYKNDNAPIFAVPTTDKSLTSCDLFWTMSFNEMQYERATGLVVERINNTKVETYFAMPDMDSEGKIELDSNMTFSAQNLEHHVSGLLMRDAPRTDDLDTIYDLLEAVKTPFADNAFGKFSTTFHEHSKPFSIYNWELGFHAIHMIVERLFATQQYDLALQIARYVFDPSADSSDKDGATANASESSEGGDTAKDATKKDEVANKKTNKDSPMSRLDRCWRFPPFKSSELRAAGSVRDILRRLKPDVASNAISDWESSPFDPFLIARSRPAVYMKRFVILYVKILLAEGDELFREGSLDSLPHALAKYVEAFELFGPSVNIIPPRAKRHPKAYADVSKLLNAFGTANVDMELEFPFFYNDLSSKTSSTTTQKHELLGLVQSPYFTVPPNEDISSIKELIDDRLYKIRNSLDINGIKKRYTLFEKPADPMQLINSAMGGGDPFAIAPPPDGPMPNYRFQYLLTKAFEICNELKQLGDQYLGNKEKWDAEKLSRVRALHDVSLNQIQIDVKLIAKEEAAKTLDTLKETRDSHAMRLEYYLALIGEKRKVPKEGESWVDIRQNITPPVMNEFRTSPYERIDLKETKRSNKFFKSAMAKENICAFLAILPQITANVQPMGIGISTRIDASLISNGIAYDAAVLKNQGQVSVNNASMAAKKAQLVRQLQERILQANLAARDIKNIDKQIQAQNIKIKGLDKDIAGQRQMLANSKEVEELLRTKYTNQELYAWMDRSIRDLAKETYLNALSMARSVERAYSFEHVPDMSSTAPKQFIRPSYWTEGKDGFFAAQGLHLDLRRLEAEYMQKRSHNYEITKNISLKQIDPWGLLVLQTTGSVEFEIPEELFDCDFPGHYCRRIKTIAVTIPCIFGPWTSLSCTLRLLEHSYRLKSSKAGVSYYPAYRELDDRFKTDRIPIEAIALSNGQHDSGVFDLNFRDERYLPFEGAGAISKWRLDLPTIKSFDYGTISDVVINMRYTSLEGGGRWAELASTAVGERLNGKELNPTSGQIVLFDVRAEFSAAWALAAYAVPSKVCTLKLGDLKGRLPYWTRGRQAKVVKAWVVMLPSDPKAASGLGKVTIFGKKMVSSSKGTKEHIALETEPANLDYQIGECQIDIENGAMKGLPLKNMWIVLQFVA